MLNKILIKNLDMGKALYKCQNINPLPGYYLLLKTSAKLREQNYCRSNCLDSPRNSPRLLFKLLLEL